MNTNTRIVILVFDDVVPRSPAPLAYTETLAQEIARRYQEPGDAAEDDRESREVRGLRSLDVKIVH